jgi:hypothetical protein
VRYEPGATQLDRREFRELDHGEQEYAVKRLEAALKHLRRRR